MRIYLDVCCLNRPFDEQSQDRIKIETDAVLSILNRCCTGKWELLGSEAIDFEISQIPDDERRAEVEALLSLASVKITVDKYIENRAIELIHYKIYPFDALHIACSEMGMADVMLTTDDNLLRKAARHKSIIKIRVENPVTWLMEVIQNGN